MPSRYARSAGAAALFCLFYFSALSVVAATSNPKLHRRRIAETNYLTAECDSSTISSSDPLCTSSSVINGGTLIQECTAVENTLFTGTILVEGSQNSQSQPVDCCSSCFAKSRCNVWVYCNNALGCPYPTNNSSVETIFPYQGCQLLEVVGFKESLLSEAAKKFTYPGKNVFTSGSLLSISLPRIFNYTLMPSSEVTGYDYACCYPCNSTEYSTCRVKGPPAFVAEACNEDRRCRGFVYYPGGIGSDITPVGLLKGGEDVDHIEIESLTDNPSMFLYVKHSDRVFGPHIDTINGPIMLNISSTSNNTCTDSSDSCDALWLLFPTVAAVCVAIFSIVFGVMFMKHHKLQKQKEMMMCPHCSHHYGSSTKPASTGITTAPVVVVGKGSVVDDLKRTSGGSSNATEKLYSSRDISTEHSKGSFSSVEEPKQQPSSIIFCPPKPSSPSGSNPGKGGVLVCRSCGLMQPMGEFTTETLQGLQSMGYFSGQISTGRSLSSPEAKNNLAAGR